jgi:hypothetical protein
MTNGPFPGTPVLRIIDVHMKTRPDRAPRRPASHSPPRQAPLSERRFEDLLQQASAFFAQAERDPVAEKQAVIEEILETLNRHGLTVADLRSSD